MDAFLAQGLKAMNILTQDDLGRLSNGFRTSLVNNFEVFGRHAFRKHIEHQDNRSVLNASLWDVMSTGLARYPEGLVEERAGALRAAFYPLMENHQFTTAITYGPNDILKVRHRFSVATRMFREVFGAD